METNIVPNSDDVFCYNKSHSERWNDRYNRMSLSLQFDEEIENAELTKYISRRRDLFYIQNYFNESGEYYDYIEKTLLELQTQKR